MLHKKMLFLIMMMLALSLFMSIVAMAVPIQQTSFDQVDQTAIQANDNDSALVDSQVVNTMKMALEKNTDAIRNFQVNSALKKVYAHASQMGIDQVDVYAVLPNIYDAHGKTAFSCSLMVFNVIFANYTLEMVVEVNKLPQVNIAGIRSETIHAATVHLGIVAISGSAIAA